MRIFSMMLHGYGRIVLCAAALGLQAGAARAQTFQPFNAVDHERVCKRFLGIPTKCVNLETQRITRTYTEQKLGVNLYAETWATASHCTSVDAESQCQRSVAVSTDPSSSRLVWGRSDQFIRAYGQYGSEFGGAGYLAGPRGLDITRREGDWHVSFIADTEHNRVVALATNYVDQREVWLGAITGAETGIPLSQPHDVSWDHRATWEMTDDQVYIADTGNDRIVAYHVSIDFNSGTPVMSSSFRGALGTTGLGAMQLNGPRGVAVRSNRLDATYTTIYISDTGNARVLRWDVHPFQFTATQSADRPLQAEPLGISIAGGGDVLVADRAYNRILKLRGPDLMIMTQYGTAWNAWADGNFNAPTDVHVVHEYRSLMGMMDDRTLPFVQTTERWTPSTGGQMHRLGVDAVELVTHTQPGGCWASMWFVLTGSGSYRVRVKNAWGGVVREFPTVVTSSGWKNEYWNGRDGSGGNVPPGTYSYEVLHESGYTYDDGEPRTSQSGGFPMDCYAVSASAPGYVGEKGTYYLDGAVSHGSDSFRWRQSVNGNGYWDWDYAQYSSFTTYEGDSYTADWEFSARRTSDGSTGAGYQSTQVNVWGGSGCGTQVICNREMPLAALGDTSVHDSAQTGAARRDTLRRVPGQGRLRDHYGSGAWVGGRTERGPEVVQLFSLFGTHQSAGTTWPNALAAGGEAAQTSADGQRPVRVAFTSQGTEGHEGHRVRFSAAQAGFRDGYVGLALDPDLGLRAGDDSLGVDTETGLVWVADPDSGAIGYLVTGRPAGSRLVVRQFSRRKESWRPDPAADSAAFAELTASESALTGRRDDVRFVIALGPVPLGSGDVEVGLAVLRAPSLDDLRRQAADVAARQPAVAAAGKTGITRFRITQAPPQVGASLRPERVSPNLIPGLAAEAGIAPERRVIAPDLREQVRANGITGLAFAVPDGTTARVEIRIHDASGRIVRRLTDESYEPGAYRMQWDEKDEGGARVAPGVYIAVMQAEGYRGTTRLVVVR